jgi:2-C-methyl-D-erythritol 4-phosphate cytidylyltransferase/2-C-methyl-D-erythritol 2,4-cyclodiphosphate synthase
MDGKPYSIMSDIARKSVESHDKSDHIKSSGFLPFHAVIVAAGTGSRSGGKIPKQYAEIAGKPVLQHTLDRLVSLNGLQSVVIVIAPEQQDLFETFIHTDSSPVLVAICHGGTERNTSVYNGLKDLPDIKNEDIVIIHDAARPLFDSDDVYRCVQKAHKYMTATLASPVSSSLRRGSGQYVDRTDLWQVQTPQAFRYDVILKAHDDADLMKKYTDDAAMVQDMGIDVPLVEGTPANIKITYPHDFTWAEMYLATQKKDTKMMETLSGQGFDVHAFDTSAPGPVTLFGIDVPYEFKLKGHSDADVGLHAITDALLGAIGEGDIGLHFPPSDPQWKDCDSAHFLIKSIEKLHEQGGKLRNIDATLICERPKLGEYRDKMRENVAKLCGIDAKRVNIKATTTEKLGFTGRKEGIAAQAIVNVALPALSTNTVPSSLTQED